MVRAVLGAIHADIAGRTDRGTVASYIPELGNVDPSLFGMSVCLASGEHISVGHAEVSFSTQSISKVLSLAIALGRVGDDLWARIGREPSTHDFNSIQELEVRKGHPPNPLVNSGAIATTEIILGQSMPAQTIGEILQFVRTAASDDNIFVDPSVASSETKFGHRNWALAHCLTEFGNLKRPCEITLGTYFHQCAISMTCEQLARYGTFLAGIQALPSIVSKRNIRRINALMFTCGQYNGSGEFAFRVRLPAKSGVGGSILAIVPGLASIAVWSAGLDKLGNSHLGTVALEHFSNHINWSIFHLQAKADSKQLI